MPPELGSKHRWHYIDNSSRWSPSLRLQRMSYDWCTLWSPRAQRQRIRR